MRKARNGHGKQIAPLIAGAALLAACSAGDPEANATAGADNAVAADSVSAANTAAPAAPAGTAGNDARPRSPDLRVASGEWLETSELLDVTFEDVPGSEEQLAAARARMEDRPPPERRRCRAPNEPVVPYPPEQNPDCSFERYAVADGKVDIAVACPDPRGGTMRSSVTGSYSDTRTEMVHDMRGPFPAGGTMRVRVRVTDRRVGDCRP